MRDKGKARKTNLWLGYRRTQNQRESRTDRPVVSLRRPLVRYFCADSTAIRTNIFGAAAAAPPIHQPIAAPLSFECSSPGHPRWGAEANVNYFTQVPD